MPTAPVLLLLLLLLSSSTVIILSRHCRHSTSAGILVKQTDWPSYCCSMHWPSVNDIARQHCNNELDDALVRY
jgi:hypothetical protein